MRKVEIFKLTPQLYAVMPDPNMDLSNSVFGMKAMWFKRKNGLLKANLGILDFWLHRETLPANLTLEQFLTRRWDGRYGGRCFTSWDGQSLWTQRTFEESMKDKELLDAALANFPNIPEGFNGWWAF